MLLTHAGTSGRYDALHAAHDDAMAAARGRGELVGLVGYGITELFDGDGTLVQVAPFTNLITDVGDLYYAQKGIVGIGPVVPTAPGPMNGMKLGTSTTTPTKAGAAAVLIGYITGSNLAFDASYAQTANLGTTLGVNMVYKTTYAPGVATNATINETALVTDQATNTAGTAGTTIARAIITLVNKTAPDTLAVTWNHKCLG